MDSLYIVFFSKEKLIVERVHTLSMALFLDAYLVPKLLV